MKIGLCSFAWISAAGAIGTVPHLDTESARFQEFEALWENADSSVTGFPSNFSGSPHSAFAAVCFYFLLDTILNISPLYLAESQVLFHPSLRTIIATDWFPIFWTMRERFEVQFEHATAAQFCVSYKSARNVHVFDLMCTTKCYLWCAWETSDQDVVYGAPRTETPHAKD